MSNLYSKIMWIKHRCVDLELQCLVRCDLLMYMDQFYYPSCITKQWRIQDFLEGGAPTPEGEEGCVNLLFCKIFAKNCMKMKEFRPRRKGRGLGAPLGSATAKYFLWAT